MTAKTHACVSIHCDVCKETFDCYDEGVEAHFDKIGDATGEAGHCHWFIADDGIALCGDGDEPHLAQARAWLDAGKLTADEVTALCEVYPQLMPDDEPGEIDGQLALAGTAATEGA